MQRLGTEGILGNWMTGMFRREHQTFRKPAWQTSTARTKAAKINIFSAAAFDRGYIDSVPVFLFFFLSFTFSCFVFAGSVVNNAK